MAENRFVKCLYIILAEKHWVALILAGLLVFILGVWTLISTQASRSFVIGLVNFCEKIFPTLNLQQGIVCLLFGLIVIAIGVFFFVKQYIQVAYPIEKRSFYRTKILQKGPKIVVIGGGTGLSMLIRGLKEHTWNITAAVTVGDDGGSSGRLREQYGVIPLGDIRHCLVALSDREDLMEQLFDYRFAQGEELTGHSLGNLLLLAMGDLKGDFKTAVKDINEILYLRGKALPIAEEALTLRAKLEDGTEICGEKNFSALRAPITRLEIEPKQVKATEEVLAALQQADAIVLGPGSLYTSILPNLLVQGVVEAVKNSKAKVFYVCNIMTEPGETEHYTAQKHLQEILSYSGDHFIDYVLVNNNKKAEQSLLQQYQQQGTEMVEFDRQELERCGVKVIAEDFLRCEGTIQHDSFKLAHVICKYVRDDRKKRKVR